MTIRPPDRSQTKSKSWKRMDGINQPKERKRERMRNIIYYMISRERGDKHGVKGETTPSTETCCCCCVHSMESGAEVDGREWTHATQPLPTGGSFFYFYSFFGFFLKDVTSICTWYVEIGARIWCLYQLEARTDYYNCAEQRLAERSTGRSYLTMPDTRPIIN